MEIFTAAPHHDVLKLLVQFAVLLVTARLLGSLARRLGQPQVVGEILSGVLLGPSLLSGIFPALGHWIVPEPGTQGHLLEVVSLIGALMLLLLTGLETDLVLIRRHARTALGVSFGGILVTFTTGFALGWTLPDALLANPDDRLVFSLFVATAMSISAIPVIAKVLMDLDLMRRDVGQTIIAAGMSDDTVGWILLSIVAGLASDAEITSGAVATIVLKVGLFLVLSLTAGRWLLKRLLDVVEDNSQSEQGSLTFVMAVTFAMGAITMALGLEAVLGAFVGGIVLGQLSRLPDHVHHRIASIAFGVFTPVFFATAGLKVDARALLDPSLALAALLVVTVATGGKVVGTFLGARFIGGKDPWTALAFGAGLNARGAMEIIIATIGLELGILSREMFSIVVVMAMATSLMAPPALRFVLARVQPTEEELDRLRREELARRSWLTGLRRVLMPVRRRETVEPVHRVESFLLDRLASRVPISATLMTVTEPGTRSKGAAFLDRIGQGMSVSATKRVVEGGQPLQIILDEAARGYDLMVIGASEPNTDGSVFHPFVDELVRLAACSTWIVQGRRFEDHWPPRRVLVPTNGTLAARRAAEVGFLLAGEEGEVWVLNVVVGGPSALPADARSEGLRREIHAGWSIVEDLAALGGEQVAAVHPRVQTGANPESAILAMAEEIGADLIVLGADVRSGSSRLFLGPRVARVLGAAPCPVLVVNAA